MPAPIYITMSGTGPRGRPGQAGPPVVIYQQGTPSANWIVKHGLACIPSAVGLWTPSGELFKANIVVLNENTIEVKTDEGLGIAGTAVVLGSNPGDIPLGSSEGSNVPAIYEQKEASNEWTFEHNLGRLPASVMLYNTAGEEFEAVVVANTTAVTVKMEGGITATGKVVVI